jgi:hypothetical protein
MDKPLRVGLLIEQPRYVHIPERMPRLAMADFLWMKLLGDNIYLLLTTGVQLSPYDSCKYLIHFIKKL